MALIELPKPLASAFSTAARAALGLISSASTLAAPAWAAASARMPEPVPTSATLLPLRSKFSRSREERAC